MKNLFHSLTVLFILLNLQTYAQVPQKLNYQGIARDAEGSPMVKQQLNLKLSLLPTSDASVAEYEETQLVTTNEFGLYALQIGNGIPITGNMKTVKWETGNKYIRVAIDVKGGNDFIDAGTTQLLSVPYALYADKAGSSNSTSRSENVTRATNNYIEKTNGVGVANSTSLLYDNGTNIGLGTTSPAAKFHINQNVAAVQEHLRMQNISTTGAGRFTMYNDGANSYATFTKYGTTYAGNYGGSTLYPYANLLAFGNNGLLAGDGMGRFLISNSGNIGMSFYKAGVTKLKFHADFASENVGIGGNALPVSRVHLNNTDGTTMDLRLTNNTSGHTNIDGLVLSNSGGTASLMNLENAAFNFGTNNSTSMTISAGGNVGIGTSSPLAKLHVVGSKTYFETSHVGIGTNNALNSFTGLTLKNNVNNYYGMYIDAGLTGKPFYGYALNGVAMGYHQYNGSTNQYEYYNGAGAIPDFQISTTKAAFQNASFLGVGTETPTTGFTGFALKKNINDFLGMYVDAGTTGKPFYGYALNGIPKSYTSFSSANDAFEYHQTSDATPDFYINGNTKAVFNTNFLGIGASSPTSGFTSFAIKKNINDFLGMYIDAGATGKPFYGYALNGIPSSYTSFNSANDAFEYHQTSDATPDFYINGNTKAVFNTNFLGIGTSSPTSSFTSFAIKKNINDFLGMYIDAGATGKPFYGYALNGIAKSYTSFSSANEAFEYHQTSDATPDFYINGNTKAVFNTNFLGIGTSSPTTAFTGFTLKKNINDFLGMYIDAGTTGKPFYGYSLNGIPAAYTTFNGNTNQFEYHHTSDATPDFAVSNTEAVFPIQTFLGIGTSIPTNSSTGLTLKKNSNSYFGQYIDAGATGKPFYGYALNGVGSAWTELDGVNNNWVLNYGGPRITVSSSGNVGIGTSAPAEKLSVSGNICYTGSIAACSDIRYKKNIKPLENSLQKVLNIQGVQYDWKVNEFPDKHFNNNSQIGFIAQDLEKIYPELVLTDATGYKSVDYAKLTPILVEAIKELKEENEKLKSETNNLKASNSAMIESNEAMRTDILKIKEQLGMDLKAQGK